MIGLGLECHLGLGVVPSVNTVEGYWQKSFPLTYHPQVKDEIFILTCDINS